eukprot:360578-Chlamydomonas_euryale.AAC.21
MFRKQSPGVRECPGVVETWPWCGRGCSTARLSGKHSVSRPVPRERRRIAGNLAFADSVLRVGEPGGSQSALSSYFRRPPKVCDHAWRCRWLGQQAGQCSLRRRWNEQAPNGNRGHEVDQDKHVLVTHLVGACPMDAVHACVDCVWGNMHAAALMQPPPKAQPSEIGPHMQGVRTDAEYDMFMSETAGKTALMQFGSTWCVKCAEFFPTFYSLSKKYTAIKYAVAQVDYMNERAKDIRYSPTFAFYRDGRRVDLVVGKDANKLEDHLWLHNDA